MANILCVEDNPQTDVVSSLCFITVEPLSLEEIPLVSLSPPGQTERLGVLQGSRPTECSVWMTFNLCLRMLNANGCGSVMTDYNVSQWGRSKT